MDDYDQWNHAIISYFLEGVQRGTSIFLSVDDDVIPHIGREFGTTKETSLYSFCSAVREHVIAGNRIKLSRVEGHNAFGEPNGVAFLATMVLAASRMAEEDLTSDLNYFKRLREVLNLPVQEGRPGGLSSGAEEPLWKEWALWLQEQGFLPSAYAGGGPTKFTNYPISQTLLRRTDKDRLRRLFTERHWQLDWDIDMLLGQIKQESLSLSQHLRELLGSDGLRYRAATEVIYDFYEDWQDTSSIGQFSTDTVTVRIPHLSLGLYRTEDLLRDYVEYFLYPHVRRRHRVEQIQVWFRENLCTLIRERPGWYLPIGPIQGEELDQGAQFSIEQPSEFNELLLPKRQFWILIPDPENPDTDAYATWGSPSLGTPFVILCRKELIPQLERLKGERLIEWSGKPYPLPTNELWVEIRQCMVILQEWSGVRIENQELYDALRPKQSLGISISGGLCVPALRSWLEEYGPQITIFGFEPQVRVKVIRITDNRTIAEWSQPINEAFSVEWPSSGNYRIEASYAGEEAVRRLIKIVPWEQLHLLPPERKETTNLNGLHIQGAFIEE